MRLLLAIAEMAMGGAETVVCDLAAAASRAGDEVAVVAAPGPLDGRLDQAALSRFALARPGGEPFRTPRAVLGLRGALREFRPDLIHAHNPRVTAAALAARRLAGLREAPLLSTYHGVPPDRSRAAARVLRRVDRVACVSGSLRDDLVEGGVRPERVTVVRNGSSEAEAIPAERLGELDRELGLGDGPVVSAIGRLTPQKNHARFLEAVALAAPEIPHARFLIVGDGPLRAALERKARELRLEERLRFTGVRPDARDLIARSDLLVLSSNWEGFPMVALEALAAGVPLLSTPVAGVEELSAAGAAEVVSPDGEALARGMVGMLGDPSRLGEMAARARELHAREFSSERMLREYRRLYDRLLGGTPTSSRP